MQRFDLLYIPATPWKNGGGMSREVVCWPQGSSMDDFSWRVSMTRIESDAMFSVFEGVERHVLLLGGDGVRLSSHEGGVDCRISQRWEHCTFSGDHIVQCDLLGGPSSCLNIMMRQGMWRSEIKVLRGMDNAYTMASSQAGMFMVLHGNWLLGSDVVKLGQGRWWGGVPTDLLLLRPETKDSVLLCVHLEPTAEQIKT